MSAVSLAGLIPTDFPPGAETCSGKGNVAGGGHPGLHGSVQPIRLRTGNIALPSPNRIPESLSRVLMYNHSRQGNFAQCQAVIPVRSRRQPYVAACQRLKAQNYNVFRSSYASHFTPV